MEATNVIYYSAQRLRCVVVLLVLVSLALTGCKAIEQKIVYNPTVYPESWSEPTTDELCGLVFEDVCFESLDGTKLHGWFVRPEGNVAANPVLFAHGRTGHVASHKDKLFAFVRRTKANVFLFDYRGFGKSDGYPTEDGLYQDVTAARNWLACRAKVEHSEVILMGRSLGAAAVVDLAAREGGKALIIQSSFTSTRDVLKHHTRGILDGKRMTTCFNSECKIGAFSGPVFISHSREDRALPFAQGVRLASAATNSSQVVFMEMEGGHSVPPDDDYYFVLGDFLNSLSNSNCVPQIPRADVAAKASDWITL